MTSTIEGALLSLSEKGFEGWAWNTAKPTDYVDIEIVCGEHILASTRANAFSLELVQQKKGSGMHGFVVLPDALPELEYPALIRARAKGAAEFLSGEITVPDVKAFIGIVSDNQIQDFEGYVDMVQRGKIIGWAINRAMPGRPVTLELLEGTRILMSVETGQSRKDVEEQFPGAVNCGFEIPIPMEVIDDQIRMLRVRPAGAKAELTNSPITLGTGTATALVKGHLSMREEITELQGRVKALTDQVNDFVEMENAISSMAEEIMALQRDLAPNKQGGIVRQLLERFEALYAIQRDSFERELAVLRTAVLGIPRKAEPAAETVQAGVLSAASVTATEPQSTTDKPASLEENQTPPVPESSNPATSALEPTKPTRRRRT